MSRPLVTIAFPSYQQERYVRQALRSVLAQTYSPLQVVISDDASTDHSDAIIREEVGRYQGPHTIEVHRNQTRLGIENYNQLMAMARGEFIVIAHSDDLSVPDRVERLVAAWQDKGVSLVSSNVLRIDSEGVPGSLLNDPGRTFDVSLRSLATQGWNFGLLGATLAWERAVFERFGPLSRVRSAVSTDWILPFRAALLRGVRYTPEPLVHYRYHPQSAGCRLLNHNAHDQAAHRESGLAQQTTQFIYMLHTLQQHLGVGKQTPQLEQLRELLVQSIFRSAEQWTLVRNQLLSGQHQVRWVPSS